MYKFAFKGRHLTSNGNVKRYLWALLGIFLDTIGCCLQRDKLNGYRLNKQLSLMSYKI